MGGALKAACAAAVLLGGILSPASSGATLIPEHPDLRIDVVSYPGTITAGKQVVYEVTITDEGVAGLLADKEITVVNTLENGDFVDGCDDLTEGVCTKNVDVPVILGGKSSFRLVAQSAASDIAEQRPRTLTITSEIQDEDLASTDPWDDTATASTDVIASGTEKCTYQGAPIGEGATACSSGFFPGGTTVAFGAHSLIVPNGPGVIGELAEVGSTSTFCKTHVCRYGIAVLENFYEVGEFKVTRSNPLRTIINTPKGDPCRGLGEKPLCSVLRYEKRPAADWRPGDPEAVIPFCTVDNEIAGDQKLCTDHRAKNPSGGLRFEVLLLSNDPGMY